MSKPDVDVKIETYVKVIIELGVDEARAVMSALASRSADDPSDPVFQALYDALQQIPKEVAA